MSLTGHLSSFIVRHSFLSLHLHNLDYKERPYGNRGEVKYTPPAEDDCDEGDDDCGGSDNTKTNGDGDEDDNPAFPTKSSALPVQIGVSIILGAFFLIAW